MKMLWLAFRKVFVGYADFKGKADPSDYVFGLVWLFMVQVAYQLFRGAIFNADGPDIEAAYAKQQTVQLILNGLLYLPLIALVSRRLNYIGRSLWCTVPLAATVLGINLNAAYGAWIDKSFATPVMDQNGGWFASFGSALLLATIIAWLFTFIVTIELRTPKLESLPAAKQGSSH